LAVCRSGEHHSGPFRRESADAKAEGLMAQELKRLNREEPGLKEHPKSHPLKLGMAARLRRETALTTRQIAQRLHMVIPTSVQDGTKARRTLGLRRGASEAHIPIQCSRVG
jgi:hypothetical protein